VAKDPASLYVGGRTLKWLKVKQRDYRVEERGWDSRNKSESTRSRHWFKFDPLAAPLRPS
jgi:hypothetical protein